MVILELDELPRDGEKLKALLNEKRYEQTRRRRNGYMAFSLLLALATAYYVVGPGLVAMIAAIVFVVSSVRLLFYGRAALTRVKD